jgi:LDH2 family malate/lactate/ureidoglycolate dehydrogenase
MTEMTAGSLAELASSALSGQGLAPDDARFIAEELVVAELSGVKTHGLGKLVSLNLGDTSAEPSIGDHGSVIAVDGNGGNGFVLFRALADRVGDLCSQYGLGAAFAHNYSRYSSLYPYTDAIARRGYVAILANSAGPPAVAPFGSVDPLTGTNPICFSFPLPGGDAQTFDFATSDLVWGAIRQATLEGTSLPVGPFLDAAGDPTSVPSEVNAVRAFGGAKGFALNLAIEIITGPLTGAKAGNDVESEFDCGACLLAIDPKRTGATDAFTEDVARLLASIRAARPEHPDRPVRSPGDTGRSRVSLADQEATTLNVPDTTVEMLRRMSSGESISELSANPLFN